MNSEAQTASFEPHPVLDGIEHALCNECAPPRQILHLMDVRINCTKGPSSKHLSCRCANAHNSLQDGAHQVGKTMVPPQAVVRGLSTRFMCRGDIQMSKRGEEFRAHEVERCSGGGCIHAQIGRSLCACCKHQCYGSFHFPAPQSTDTDQVGPQTAFGSSWARIASTNAYSTIALLNTLYYKRAKVN